MNKERKDLKYFFIIVIIVLTILLGSSMTWSLYHEYHSADEFALIEASASFNKDLLYRRWATMHGGVYVPITETTPPNPYLEFLPERDITTQTGKKLTLVDHAYMTRQVHTIAESQYGIKGHITSLRPVRIENKADVWETKALKLFEKGEEEFSSIEKVNGKEYLRYMHSMKIENNCLKCHSNQGYRLGDIRGGISVSVPLVKYNQIASSNSKTIIITYLLIYLILLILSILAYNRFLKEMIKRSLIQQKIIEHETALQTNEARLHTLVQTIPDLIWLKDTKGVYLTCNSMFERFFGAREADIVGKTDYNFVDIGLADFFRENDSKAILAGKPTSNEEWVTFADDGHHALLDTIKTPMYDSNGTLLGVLGIGHDITERKRTEEALKQLNSELENLHNNLDEAVFSVDLIHNKMLHVSIAHETVFGYSPEEFFNNPQLWYEIIVPEDKPIIDAGYPVLFSGKNLHHEYRIVHPDGQIRWIEAKMNPILDTSGKLIRIDGIASNITDRKRAEIELLEKEVQYQNLADSGLALIWTAGTDKLCNYFNQPWLKFTGRTLEQELGNGWAEGVHPDDFDSCLKTYITAFDKHEKFDMEYRLRHASGEYRWLKDMGTPNYNSSGVFIGYIGHCFDITEHKQAEKELILAKEKAEESDQLKTAFLNNISHEIRTPFNGLLGFLSLIQDEDLPTSERDEYISIINKSADRLMNTINDIVEISQIQAGQTKLTISKTHIRKLSSELYSRFKPYAESGGLKFFLNNDLPNNIESIYTDSLKLYTILSHLIDNAIKFTKEGSIQFEIRFVDQGNEFGRDKAYLFPTPSKLQFSVKDTGVGIAKSKIQAIFEKFMQADVSNTRQFEGSGLGLSIAKAYVEMLGGKIWVESNPEDISEGKGSTFFFTLPYYNEWIEKMGTNEDVSEDIVLSPINPKVSGLKILIVEDDETSELFLRNVIKLFSREILNTRTGIETVEACRKNPDFDLILMDIKMPVMDGYEATRQIRQFNKGVIIIAQTAFGLTGDREKAIAAGCNDYISKPIKKDQLMVLMQKYF